MNELLIHNAEEKLKAGLKSKNPAEFGTLIQNEVMKALLDFCRQEPKIAEAIIKSDKQFYECCAEIVKDTKAAQYISDFEAYRRALRFYFPDAEIECSMTVKVKGSGSDAMRLSLFDLME